MKFVSFLLLLSFWLPAFGQPFNSAIDLGYPLNHFRDMIVDNDTIVAYGLGFSNDSILQQGLLLSKFDSSGQHLFSTIVLDPQGAPLFIDYFWGKIAKTRDGGYIMTAAPTNRIATWLIKTDHDFEVEFIKEYLDTVNRRHYRYNVPIELSDGYLLSGSIQRPNYKNDAFARRVDSQGHTIWFKYYGDYDVSDVFNDIAKVNDTLFVAFSTIVDANDPNTGFSSLKYIDLNGNVIRTWQSEINPEIGFARKILLTPDGGLITFGLHLVEVINEASYVEPTLAKLDSNFQTEWIRHFGYVHRLGTDITFWDLEPLSDRNYIGAGESVTDPGSEPRQRTGWLYKFSPEGDKIWEVLPNTPFQPLSEQDVGIFAGVGELSSGSIVAAGEAIDGNQRHIWLVKATPDGCLDTLCSLVSVVEEEVVVEKASPAKLYPNPSRGTLTLELPAAATLVFYNLQGRPLLQQSFGKGIHTLSLPKGQFLSGLYLVEMVFASGQRERLKLILTQ